MTSAQSARQHYMVYVSYFDKNCRLLGDRPVAQFADRD